MCQVTTEHLPIRVLVQRTRVTFCCSTYMFRCRACFTTFSQNADLVLHNRNVQGSLLPSNASTGATATTHRWHFSWSHSNNLTARYRHCIWRQKNTTMNVDILIRYSYKRRCMEHLTKVAIFIILLTFNKYSIDFINISCSNAFRTQTRKRHQSKLQNFPCQLTTSRSQITKIAEIDQSLPTPVTLPRRMPVLHLLSKITAMVEMQGWTRTGPTKVSRCNL